MPQIHVNGLKAAIPAEQVDRVKEQISDLRHGQAMTLNISDEDGDVTWLFIPFGAAVMIQSWDPPNLEFQRPAGALGV